MRIILKSEILKIGNNLLSLVLHWAIAVLSSASVSKGKLIGRNILLKVLCYSLSRQRETMFCLLDSVHIFYYYLFIFPFKRGRNSVFIRIPHWVWESCSISQSILTFRSNSFKTWQWKLSVAALHCSISSFPSNSWSLHRARCVVEKSMCLRRCKHVSAYCATIQF